MSYLSNYSPTCQHYINTDNKKKLSITDIILKLFV